MQRKLSEPGHWLMLNRKGYFEGCYFTFSYPSLRNETDAVCGILVPTLERLKRY